jgi:hypothetical protein
MTDDRSRREGRSWSTLALATLGVGLAALLTTLLPRWVPSSPAPDRPPADTTLALEVAEAVPARRTGAVAPEAPTSARLPDGTRVPIRAVSTRADGLLDVPDDIRTAGWWRGGSRLGDPLGSTLLAAHVDSRSQGLGPYVALLTVHPGQRVTLTSRTLRQVFRVTSLRLVDRHSLPRQHWVSSASGPRRLVLVTCAPPYDPSRGGYRDLAIVTAVPVTTPTRKLP